MAAKLNRVLEHLHRILAPPGGDVPDGQLLARFVAARDEAAFAALMRRHGPMVLGVCRRLLRHEQDAEDCFQAVFLVLARKAAVVRGDAVGSWLYSVTYRTALEARAIRARRRKRERQVENMPQPEVMPPEAQDWRPWLDHELNRLPESYRAAIVACDLEGRSRKEAARLLGLAEGTVSSRLARGRRLLAQRLSRRGLTLTGGVVAAALVESAASAPVPAALLASTAKTALLVAAGELTAVSASIHILMKGALKSMILTKLKLAIGAVMIVTALGASGLVYRASGQSASAEKKSDGKPRSELERLRHENELLKLNLEVVLEKVRAQEAELRTLKNPAQAKKIQGTAFTTPDGQKLIAGTDGTLRLWDLQTGKILSETPVKEGELKKLEGARGKQDAQSAANQLIEEIARQKSDVEMRKERATWSERMSQPGREYVTTSQAEADKARLLRAQAALESEKARLDFLIRLNEAESALRKLREAGDAESRRKAEEALDRVLKKLREGTKKSETGKP